MPKMPQTPRPYSQSPRRMTWSREFGEKSSETCPVVYSTQQRQYEPFSSPGFHSLDPPSQIRKRSLRSAIVLYTEAVQARYVIRSMRERQACGGFGNHRPYSQPELEVKRTGDNCVNMRVLTADGKVIRSPDLAPLPLYYRDETLAVRPSTPTKKISLIPKQNVLIPCVGPVVNGMNPSQTCESGKISPACCKAPPASTRRGVNSSAHTSTPPSGWSSSRNQMDFLSISRPVKCCETGVNCIIREKLLHHDDCLKEANEASEVCVCEDCDAFSVNDMRSPHETADLISPCSATDSEKTPKDNASSWQPETINIPTAEYLD
ncbi:uncharacterized protein LOC131362073 isoform X1 [Hemibagrus wyckioides]|uniref:uncharacterized protein LOC131362073 isoform X1 n=1 Tax=Hemibagrus wyckioides TaxID=337641 RepID=UPI00266CC7E5|nr:uncharacterized protein LOC131362073 isoform X1 [Hemibagrus wyckioides]